MLTIALDAQHTRHSRAGIARYARGLADELRKMPGVRVVELGGGDILRRGTLRKKLLSVNQDLLWYPFKARRKAAEARADIYHSPLLRGPLRRGQPAFVMTVHDLVPVRWPETMPRWNRWYTARVMRRLVDAADRIIAPSQDTANDLNMLLQVPSERIRVVPNGVDDQFFQARRDPAPHERYVLFVGTPEPRKNLRRLVSAMAILQERGFSGHLKIVGSGGWGDGVQAGSRVQHVGRVDDQELQSLYANASCLALPSLHEGFGLPALEAMAVGCPVVVSDQASLPEVCGNAALYAPPDAPEAWFDRFMQLRNSEALRLQMIGKGRARASAFSWRATALRYLKAMAAADGIDTETKVVRARELI